MTFRRQAVLLFLASILIALALSWMVALGKADGRQLWHYGA